MSRMILTTAVLSLLGLPALAATINVGIGKKDFMADQEMAYPRTQTVQVTTTKSVTFDTVEPAAGMSMPEDNSMMPVNSKAKPSMPNAEVDANPKPAVK